MVADQHQGYTRHLSRVAFFTTLLFSLNDTMWIEGFVVWPFLTPTSLRIHKCQKSTHHYRRGIGCSMALTSPPPPQPPSYEAGKNDIKNNNLQSQQPERPPIPAMPSDLFRRMAQSQLELLANSLSSTPESMILYLPQENAKTGQLEFTPAVVYPDPNSERVFIASDAASGQAPTLPKTLTKLPGFSHASSLLPGYPLLPLSSDPPAPGVGVVEEVLCDVRFKTAALSVPLLSGPQTVGVLLVSPAVAANGGGGGSSSSWTLQDQEQVSTAAQSLSMALTMDNERNFLREQNTAFREGLSDSLHQVKNPIQALRTYGKILQRQIVETTAPLDNTNHVMMGSTLQLLDLAERLMVQSERVVDLLGPMDSLVENLDTPRPLVLLPPAQNSTGDLSQSMVLWQERPSSEQNNGVQDDNSGVRRPGRLKMSSGDHKHTSDVNGASPPEHLSVSTSLSSSSSTISSMWSPNVGEFETEMTFVTDVLDPIFETYATIASEQGISFEVMVEDEEELPGVMTAPKSLQEAVSNVFDNAFKYVKLPKMNSPFTRNPNPCVRVRVFANQRDGERPGGVTISVEDNGPGVPEEDYERIFDRGYRSERTAALVEGTGIGLAIARALMRRMGGNLDMGVGSLDGTVVKFSLYRNKPKV